MSYVFLLSFIVFLPALGAIALAFFPGENKSAIRWCTLLITIVVLLATLWMAFPGGEPGQFDTAQSQMQNTFAVPWIPTFDIQYFMGVDGISFPLVVLTALVSVLACAASWPIEKNVKAYCILFLLLETGLLGVFMSLDFFLFYVFWEVMLLPMYFLIGVWGGPRKEYAAIKFFLYTLVGSVLMLIAILMLYFASDLTVLDAKQLAAAHVLDEYYERSAATNPAASTDESAKPAMEDSGESAGDSNTSVRSSDDTPTPPMPPEEDESADEGEGAALNEDLPIQFVAFVDEHPAAAEHDEPEATSPAAGVGEPDADQRNEKARDLLLADIKAGKRSAHTFNILAMQKMGQLEDGPFTSEEWTFWGITLQHWAFWLLFIGFAIKVPSVPLHTWLPDAHVEAPTPISMILAGVLLKMGGYGIIRMCYPICPLAAYECAFWVCLIGVVSMVYGAFAAMAQKDFKRLVAYSSVSHMGYVVLGLGVWSMGRWSTGETFNPEYWNMGVQGAMFQMIAHGISSAGMFFMVGVIYDRVHHRNLNEFGGLFGKMPGYTAMAIGLFFAGLGLPGLCGFIGEVLVVLSVWKFSIVLAVISASVVILTAGYILWAIQRVYLGAEYKGPHPEALVPMTVREWSIAVPLFVLAIILGLFPYRVPIINMPSVLQYMGATVDAQTNELKQWTEMEAKKQATMSAQSQPNNANETMLAESP